MVKSNNVKFAPQVYTDWNEIFKTFSESERSETLLGISGYPNYEPQNVQLWDFIKGQLDNQFERYKSKCERNGEISRNYWNSKKDNISNDIQSIPNDIHNYNNNYNNNLKQELEQETINITKTEQEYIGSNKFITITEDFRFEQLFQDYASCEELCNRLNKWFRETQIGKDWHIESIQRQAQNFINKNPKLLNI